MLKFAVVIVVNYVEYRHKKAKSLSRLGNIRIYENSIQVYVVVYQIVIINMKISQYCPICRNDFRIC